MEHISVEHWDSSSALSSEHMEPSSNGSDNARCRITFSFGSSKERNVFRTTNLLAVGSSKAGAAVNTTEGMSASSGRLWLHCKCARRSALRCLQDFLGAPRSETQGPSPVSSSGRSTAAGAPSAEAVDAPVVVLVITSALASSAEAIDASVVVLVIASALSFPRLHWRCERCSWRRALLFIEGTVLPAGTAAGLAGAADVPSAACSASHWHCN